MTLWLVVILVYTCIYIYAWEKCDPLQIRETGFDHCTPTPVIDVVREKIHFYHFFIFGWLPVFSGGRGVS